MYIREEAREKAKDKKRERERERWPYEKRQVAYDAGKKMVKR
jgi:hypothetical protein